MSKYHHKYKKRPIKIVPRSLRRYLSTFLDNFCCSCSPCCIPSDYDDPVYGIEDFVIAHKGYPHY